MQGQKDNKRTEDKQEQRQTRTSRANKTGKDMRAGYLDRERAARDMYSLRCDFQSVKAWSVWSVCAAIAPVISGTNRDCACEGLAAELDHHRHLTFQISITPAQMSQRCQSACCMDIAPAREQQVQADQHAACGSLCCTATRVRSSQQEHLCSLLALGSASKLSTGPVPKRCPFATTYAGRCHNSLLKGKGIRCISCYLLDCA